MASPPGSSSGSVDTLPSFSNPPLIEMVLGIQFSEIQRFTTAHAGLLWSELRKDYPKITEQAALAPMFETFGGLLQPSGMVQFQQIFSPPTPRYWFQSAGGDFLMQLQTNKLILNWRKMDAPPGSYPRYHNLRLRFESEIRRVAAFLKKEDLGAIRPNQAEANYVNHISIEEARCLKEITTVWNGAPAVPGAEIENEAFQTKYILADESGPFGRLYTQIAKVIVGSGVAYRLEIFARGRPKDESVAGAFALLDLERAAIVRAFDAFTSDGMHVAWGREHA